MFDRVVVRVPATTANLGPGYDCMGMALDLWNDLEVRKSEKHECITIGEGEGILPSDSSNLVLVGFYAALERLGKSVDFPLKFTCTNRIPFARGLGSSSAAIVSGILAAYAITESVQNSIEEILDIASIIEGHPDNVAPCISGGAQVGYKCSTTSRWRSSSLKIGCEMTAVLFVPSSVLETKTARGVLGPTIPREDAVFNVSRTALLCVALSGGNGSLLKAAMEDKLHQPQRAAIIPHLSPLISSLSSLPNVGSCLSGAGSTVLAILPSTNEDLLTSNQGLKEVDEVISNWKRVASELNMDARILVTTVTKQGAHISKREHFGAGASQETVSVEYTRNTGRV